MAIVLSQRKLILNDLETTLEGIQPTNPDAQSEVQQVEQVVRHWGDVPSGIRPWIGFMTGIEAYEYQPFNVLRVTLPVTIMAYVFSKDLESRQILINALLDDILVAVNADQTRGGNATMTTVRSVDTDEGDHEGDGIIRVDLDIVYFRTTGLTC